MSKNSLEDKFPDIICSLTQEIMNNPVITNKGISYEKKDIEKWKGEIFEWKGLGYSDLPWEAEALEKEVILFHNLIEKTSILDDYMDHAMHRDPETFYEGEYAKIHPSV